MILAMLTLLEEEEAEAANNMRKWPYRPPAEYEFFNFNLDELSDQRIVDLFR